MSTEALISALEAAWDTLLFILVICGMECIALTALLFGGLLIRKSWSSLITFLEHKAMRSFILLLALLIPSLAKAQVQTAVQQFNVSTPFTFSAIDERPFFAQTRFISWNITPNSGSPLACNLEVDTSVDGVTFVATIPSTPCTSNSSASATGSFNFSRVNVTTLTGASLSICYKIGPGAGCGQAASGGGSLSSLTVLPAAGPIATATSAINMYVPLAASGTFTSIVCAAGTCTVTGCAIFACGLPASGTPTLNIGGNTVNCFDVSGNVTGTSAGGFTMTSGGATCTDTGSTFTNAIGQFKAAYCWGSAAGISAGNFACWNFAADAHNSYTTYNNFLVVGNCDFTATGEYGCGSGPSHRNLAFGIGPDAKFCIAQPYANLNTNCTTTAYDNTGTPTIYRGIAVVNDIKQAIKLSGSFSGSTFNSISYSSPTLIFTAPASGFGSNTAYLAYIFFQADSTTVSGTMFATLTYQQAVTGTSVSRSTCGVATNLMCVGTSGVGSPLVNIGDNMEALIPFSLQPSGTLNLTLTTGGTGTVAGVGFISIWPITN